MNWYCVEHLKYIFKVYLFSGPRSPLSDYHKVIASNQYALPILAYAMWPQAWPLSELQQLDRETRKIIKESGGIAIHRLLLSFFTFPQHLEVEA